MGQHSRKVSSSNGMRSTGEGSLLQAWDPLSPPTAPLQTVSDAFHRGRGA